MPIIIYMYIYPNSKIFLLGILPLTLYILHRYALLLYRSPPQLSN